MFKNIIMNHRNSMFLVLLLICSFSGCSSSADEKVIICSPAEDYRLEHLRESLNEEFQNTKISIDYYSTGNLAAKLKAEGNKTDCDIIHELEYSYLDQLDKLNILDDLTDFDMSTYDKSNIISKNYNPNVKNSGAIIINTEVLEEKGLSKPSSYNDLLKEEYKGLISMPNPKASGTGYMFLLSLINYMGEDEAFQYFDQLSNNILQYTSSGMGPVNALIQKEVAIGLGITAQAVTAIQDNKPLEILFFEPGSPYSLCGQTIIKDRQEKEYVTEIYKYILNTYNKINNNLFYPEKIFNTGPGKMEFYPANIKYANMKNNTFENREKYLDKWTH